MEQFIYAGRTNVKRCGKLFNMGLYEHLALRYDEFFPPNEACVDFVVRGMDPRAPLNLLDLGSATGGTALAFAARGWGATGLELNATMTRMARNKTASGAAETDTTGLSRPRFLQADMRDAGRLLAGDIFGAALCAGNTLPHLPPSDFAEFFRAMIGLLAPGGCMITQTLNYAHPEIGPGYVFPDIEVPGLRFVRSYAAADPPGLEFRTELVGPGGVERDLTILHAYSPDDIEGAMRAAGFGEIARFAGWAAGPFDPARDKFVIVRGYRP